MSNQMINLTQVNEVFKDEILELWRRYTQENKKPEYFPYNIKASTPQELIDYGFGQMMDAIGFVKDAYEKDTIHHKLSFDQWIVYEWFSKSLKGDNNNIFLKASLL